jgi:hypothetical protein
MLICLSFQAGGLQKSVVPHLRSTEKTSGAAHPQVMDQQVIPAQAAEDHQNVPAGFPQRKNPSLHF